MDTKGTLLWKHDNEYDKPHILITSKQVSQEYLSYLNEKNISYIVTGDSQIDLAAACKVLKETFGIERLGIVGGPAINTAFLDAGLLDEVIVLIGAGMLLLRKVISEKYIWLCSVFGAVLHNIGQIIVAILITGTPAIIAYLPFLLVSGCAAGAFTGGCAQFVIKRSKKIPQTGRTF